MAHGRHWPGDVQLEYCELCGVRLPAAERIQATTQDLAGRWVCPKCAPLVLNPSYLDFGGPGNLAPEPGEVEPHSGEDWVTSIQGETTYSSFWVGAAPGASPSIDMPLNGVALAIPLDLPRRLASNQVETITLKSNGYASTIRAAIYRQTKGLTKPGELVKDIGTVSFAAFSTRTFTVDAFLDGDAIYFLVYFGNGAGVLEGFALTDADGTLTNGTMLQATSSWYNGVGAWPRRGGAVPWTKVNINFPAFKVHLEA